MRLSIDLLVCILPMPATESDMPSKTDTRRKTPFDHILAGDWPASFVYQDELCCAFMDIRPITKGHVLVIPRKQVDTLEQLNAAEYAHLWEVARRIATAQRKSLGSLAQHFVVNDGKAASQTVPHVHIHIIPRYRGDSLHTLGKILWHVTTLVLPHVESKASRARLDKIAAGIAASITTQR